MPRRLAVSTVLMITASLYSIAPSRVAADDPAHRAEVERFQKAREVSLRAEDGWLSVSGLFWLKPGASVIGSAPSNEVVLRQGIQPAIGVLTLAIDAPQGAVGSATFQPTSGVNVLLNGVPFGGGRSAPTPMVGKPTSWHWATFA